MYAENFVVARNLYPLITKRLVKAQLTASDPASARERDYRDLLNEANLNYFHREYTIALQNYLELQAKILEQSHPELPKVGGVGSVLSGVSLGIIDHRRLLEMGRRILIDTNPGDPIFEVIGDHTYTPGAITETLQKDYERIVRLSPEEVKKLAA